MKEFAKSRVFWGVLVLIVIFRLMLASPALIWMRQLSIHDDAWVVNAASTLIGGQWLGAYDQMTLIKGAFSPIFMAVTHWLGIPYLLANEFCFLVACVFVVWTIRTTGLCRNRLLLIGAFILLAFNPASYSQTIWQRAYRNGMALWQLPVIIMSLYLVYYRRKEPIGRILPFATLAGGMLWCFVNTREDALWLWPFVLVITLISLWQGTQRTDWRTMVCRMAVFLLPIVLVIVANGVLAFKNWCVYGCFMRNDRDAGNYAKVMRDLYLIEPDPADDIKYTTAPYDKECCNIYVSTMKRAIAVSPTLALAEKELRAQYDRWDQIGGVIRDGQPSFDHMLFALRDGVADAGYYRSLPISEDYWGKVHDELQAAFADGRLSKRGFSFTAMAAPFQMSKVRRISEEFIGCGRFALAFEGFFMTVGDGEIETEMGQRFSFVTGERVPTAYDRQRLASRIRFTNRVAEIYSKIIASVIPIAALAFGFLALFCGMSKTVRDGLIDALLLLTGLVLSFILFLFCISYVSATTFPAQNCSYLCAAYVLILLFCTISLDVAVGEICDWCAKSWTRKV